MRWRRCAMVLTLACGCFHPTPWTPEGQRWVDEREGRLRAPEPAAPASVYLDEAAPPDQPATDNDGGSPDARPQRPIPGHRELEPGTVLMGYRPTVLNQVRVGPLEERNFRGYSDHGLPIGAEASCPPKSKLSLTVSDEKGGVTHAAHLVGIYVARKQDVGGHFTVKLKNLGADPVYCDVKIIALLVADP